MIARLKVLKEVPSFPSQSSQCVAPFCLGSQTYALRSFTGCPMCQETLSAEHFEHRYPCCIVALKSWTYLDLPGHSPSLCQLIANYTATWTLTSKIEKITRLWTPCAERGYCQQTVMVFPIVAVLTAWSPFIQATLP